MPIDAPVTVSADGGDLSDVRVTSAAGPVEGRVEGGTWTSTSLLEPGTDYRISASATRSDGEAVERTRAFHTIDLTLDQQTYPSIAPLDGETVGVGMPVVVTFDIPVTDRALFEKHMNVTSTPAQKGSWYWLSDSEAHFRPARYWKAGTDVSVDLDLNSLPAGNGIYGQEDRQLSTSTSATPTSTRSTPRPTRCRSSATASCSARCRSPPASRASPPAPGPR